jgi:hypothetical protein
MAAAAKLTRESNYHQLPEGGTLATNSGRVLGIHWVFPAVMFSPVTRKKSFNYVWDGSLQERCSSARRFAR